MINRSQVRIKETSSNVWTSFKNFIHFSRIVPPKSHSTYILFSFFPKWNDKYCLTRNHRHIVKQLKEAKMYSVMANVARDKRTEQLAACVRFVTHRATQAGWAWCKVHSRCHWESVADKDSGWPTKLKKIRNFWWQIKPLKHPPSPPALPMGLHCIRKMVDQTIYTCNH